MCIRDRGCMCRWWWSTQRCGSKCRCMPTALRRSGELGRMRTGNVWCRWLPDRTEVHPRMRIGVKQLLPQSRHCGPSGDACDAATDAGLAGALALLNRAAALVDRRESDGCMAAASDFHVPISNGRSWPVMAGIGPSMSSEILINASLNCPAGASTQRFRNLTWQAMAFLANTPGSMAETGVMAKAFSLATPWRSIA